MECHCVRFLTEYSEVYITPHLVLFTTASFLAAVGGIVVISISFKEESNLRKYNLRRF